MHTVKVTAIGDSINFVLPKAALGHLHLVDGDEIQISETPNGVELIAANGEFARHLEVAKSVMEEDREVLRKLAE